MTPTHLDTLRGIPLRIFLSLWVVYCAHFATDFVREHFLVVSMVERGTFQLDPYAGMHPDIFQTPDGHSYHGANPGISMLGAIPYFVLRPVVDWIVEKELSSRTEQDSATAVYDDPRPARVRFYQQARANGWDIKFGLVGLITLVFCMAPLMAWSGMVFFRTLVQAGIGHTQALGGTLLYALGTPVFFRTGYLNQNLAVAIFAFVAFALLWNPRDLSRHSVRTRHFLAGALGGVALLCDYSGAIPLAMLGLYAIWRRTDQVRLPTAVKESLWYVVGAVGPILVLWYYQWAAFGDFIRPPQHHMPPVQWSDLGYQGVAGPSWELFSLLLFDPRFGLFVTAPILALALVAPFWVASGRSFLGAREVAFALGLSLAFTVFFSSVQFTRLQYITGIRYIVPVIPFLLLVTLIPLRRLPRGITYLIGGASLALSWVMAMARIQEQEASILAPVTRVILEGFQLPALSTLSRMSSQYAPGLGGARPSALPALALTGVLVWFIWSVRWPRQPLVESEPNH